MAFLSQSTPQPIFDAAKTEPVASASANSTLGRGLVIAGNIISAGSVSVHGRVIGDIHAASVVIADGGRVDGTVKASDIVVRGIFKGKLIGGSVKLQGEAFVTGEVHNNSLAVSENTVFEGVARRLDKPVKAPTQNEIDAITQPDALPPVEAEPLALVPEQIAVATGIDNEVLA